MAGPDPREFRQMRHDVDDVYELLDGIQKSITTLSTTQRRHTNRLEEIQQSLDLHNGRLDRIDDTQRRGLDRLTALEAGQHRLEEGQREILDAIRGRPTGAHEG